jgi:hypothetical protein
VLKASELVPVELKSVAGQTTTAKSVDRVVHRAEKKLKIFHLVKLTNVDVEWVITGGKDYFWRQENRPAKNIQLPAGRWDPRLNASGPLVTKSRDFFRFS